MSPFYVAFITYLFVKFPVKNKESWFSGIGKVVTGMKFSIEIFYSPITLKEPS